MNDPDPDSCVVPFDVSGITGVINSSVDAACPIPESSRSPVECGAGLATGATDAPLDDTTPCRVTGATGASAGADSAGVVRSTMRSEATRVTGATGAGAVLAAVAGSSLPEEPVPVACESAFRVD